MSLLYRSATIPTFMSLVFISNFYYFIFNLGKRIEKFFIMKELGNVDNSVMASIKFIANSDHGIHINVCFSIKNLHLERLAVISLQPLRQISQFSFIM